MFKGWTRTEVALLWTISLVVGFIIGISISIANAKAHVMKLKPNSTPGQKIVQFENRVYHDRRVLKNHGEWKPVGRNWLALIDNGLAVIQHRRDLPRANRLLAHWQSLLGDSKAWNCIFGFENGGHGWTANTGNGYYGGLQMDLSFQRTYGLGLLLRLGTANHWSPYDQIIVAEKARRSGRGYYPWPNTARYCHLI